MHILKNWHDKFGVVVSLYIQGDFTINSKYGKELIENSSWLKFGYHGSGRYKLDMNRFYRQIHDSIKSDFRLEQIEQRWKNVRNCLNYYQNAPIQSNELIVFSHERTFQKHISQADSIFIWAKSNRYRFDFPMNNLKQ